MSSILTTNEDRLREFLEFSVKEYERQYPNQYNMVGGDWVIHTFGKAKNIPNSETIEAMKETEEMIANKDKGKTYDSFSEIVKEAMET